MAKCLFQAGGDGVKSKLKPVTATAGDVLKGKIIVDANGNPLTGMIETMSAQTITPSNVNKTVACKGKYMSGDITVKGDANLVVANIVSGKTIFGVAGNAKKLAFKNGTFDFKLKKNFNTEHGIEYLYYADINAGFYPRAYGYACNYAAGVLGSDGTFKIQGTPERNYDLIYRDVIINERMINGNIISFPSSYDYTVSGVEYFISGYY